MTAVKLKPQKRLRYEMLSLVPLVILIIAILLIFPYKVLAKKNVSKLFFAPTCTYIELTQEQESLVMEKLRSVILTDSMGVRDLRADLSLSTIPENPPVTIVEFDKCRFPGEMSDPKIKLSLIPITLAFPEPTEILGDKILEQKPTFSKEEMLKLID